MERKELKPADPKREEVIEATLRLMKRCGIKNLTMDSLAADRTMSKRTLYEMFGSKHELIKAAIDSLHSQLGVESERIYRQAENAIVALARIFNLHNRTVRAFTVDFFRDIDTLYPEIGSYYTNRARSSRSDLDQVFARGVEEGVFRTGVNHALMAQMLRVQMDAIKRDEKHVCGEFQLEDVVFNIHIGFLRSIASEKGNKELDKYLKTTDKQYK